MTGAGRYLNRDYTSFLNILEKARTENTPDNRVSLGCYFTEVLNLLKFPRILFTGQVSHNSSTGTYTRLQLTDDCITRLYDPRRVNKQNML